MIMNDDRVGKEQPMGGREGGLARKGRDQSQLVSRGKGYRGVREDSDCSAKVCVDPVVGTFGVIKGQD